MTYERPSAIPRHCKSFPSLIYDSRFNAVSALAGFLLSLSPLSCILMGWRGAGGTGASDIGAYFFFGGLLMILGAVGEVCLDCCSSPSSARS